MTHGITRIFGTLCALGVGIAASADVSARYENSVTIYGHNILGDVPERSRLVINDDGRRFVVDLPQTGKDAAVFEDIEPHVVDLNGDGVSEVIAVQSRLDAGAAMVIYGREGDGWARISATPHIGTPFRWLAVSGAADMDGDGILEIAYVEKPHLSKILRLWNLVDGELIEVASIDGLSNHRIGDNTIAGGFVGDMLRIPDAHFGKWVEIGWDGQAFKSVTHDYVR